MKRISLAIYFFLLLLLNGSFHALYSQNNNFEENLLNEDLKTSKITIDYLKNLPIEDYIIGPGDILEVIVSREYPELNSAPEVDGEGTIYLPRLHRVFVRGLTINELNNLLNDAYMKYVKYPNVEITISKYRNVTIKLIGEIADPGIKSLSGSFSTNKKLNSDEKTTYFPNLLDAIRKGGGITRFSNLDNIEIIRKATISEGGGYKKALINFKSFLNGENDRANLRIYDGDQITFKKLNKPNNKLLQKAVETDLNPKFVSINISGRIENPGKVNLPFSSTLSDALMIAGGTKVIKGKIIFVRFNNNGTIDKRVIKNVKNLKRGSYTNPILYNNDLIYVQKGLINSSTEVISDLTSPLVNIISTYGLINALSE